MTATKISRTSLWLFIPLCFLGSAIGFIVIGVVASAISVTAGGYGGLLGLIVPPVALIWLRISGRAPAKNLDPLQSTTSAMPTRATSEATLDLPGQIAKTETQTSDKNPPTPSERTNRIWLLNQDPKVQWLFALLAIASVILWLVRNSSSDLELEVTDQKTGLGTWAVLLNKGSKPIQIKDVIINGRKECADSVIPVNPLKMGDAFPIHSQCEIVEVTIKSDRGSASYKFR